MRLNREDRTGLLWVQAFAKLKFKSAKGHPRHRQALIDLRRAVEILLEEETT